MESPRTFTAFAGHRAIASGDLRTVVLATKAWIDAERQADRGKGEVEPVLVFEDQTGRQIDFDLRGTPDEALERLASHPYMGPDVIAGITNEPKRGPGRPKLGVVSREVSLLPRHWEWLEAQRGGISVALRELVEEARKRGQSKHLAKKAREAAGSFMWAIAGNLPGFEEATRALYAKDDARLRKLIRSWPSDVKKHIGGLVEEAARLEALAQQERAADKNRRDE